MKLYTTLLLTFLLTACGVRVEVPPANVGKIITKTGYQDGLIGTSKFRLDPCLIYCDRLALLQVADRSTNEDLTIFMPKDKLEMRVSIRTTLSIDTRKADELFNVIVPTPTNDSNIVNIPWDTIYQTYAQQIILINTREYLSKFSIAEVASNMEEVNSSLGVLIQNQLTEKTPFVVRNVGIVSVRYPDIITAAQENAAKRREEIQQEEAQLQISQVRLERELQEARLQRQIDFEKAEGEAAAQKIQREVVDSRVLELRRLENERLWIEKWQGQLPHTVLGDAVPMVNVSK